MSSSLPSAVERVAATYVRACSERDPALRAQLLEQCFAEDGRLVSRSREVRGRAALGEMLARFHADPQLSGIRLLSVIDAGSSTFRFRAAAELRDGTLLESLDTGQVDASGKICLILTFAGPLADAREPASAR
jgi:hypothetical protein